MLQRSPTHTRDAKASPGFISRAADAARREATAPPSPPFTSTRLAAVLILSLPAATVCRAAEEEPLATIVVTAEPIAEAERQAPTSFVTVIDTSRASEESETAAEALAQTAGVQVRRFGGLGAFSTISIRGSTSNQVRFYLDGIPLSRARNETVNLADLPLDSLERIEVYRGTIPVGFGGAGIAGVVNLVTKPPSAEPATEAAAGYGSFDTRKVVASHTQRLRGIDLLGHVTYLGTEGDFTFRDDNNTPFQPADDRDTRRKNNHFDSVEGLLKASRTFRNGLLVDLTTDNFFKSQGVPGPDSPQATDTALRELRSLSYLRFTPTRLPLSSVEASGTLFGSYERVDFEDPEGELGTGNLDRSDETSVIGANTTGTWYALPHHTPSWFLELASERFAGSNELAQEPNEPDQTRLHLTAAMQHQVSLSAERLLLVPTFRYEHVRDKASATFDLANQPTGPKESKERNLFSPAIGAEARVLPWLTFKGNLGRFERAPNFSELFGTRGSDRGNPSLDEEEGINRDIGFVLTAPPQRWLERARFEYVYFNNDYDDLIVFVTTGFRNVRPINIGAARVRGHELTLSASFLKHLSLDFNYTHHDAEDRSERPEARGNQLPGRPEDEAYVRFEAFQEWLRGYYEFNFVGGNFLNRSNFDEAPSRSIHTFGVSVRPLARGTLNFEARNVTDSQIRDVADFPLPGRSFFATMTVRF